MSDPYEEDFRLTSTNGDVVYVNISEITSAGDGVAEDVEDAIRDRFDGDSVTIEPRSRL